MSRVDPVVEDVPGPAWPAAGESVALVFADTPAERQLLRRYVEGLDGRVALREADEPGLGAFLAEGGGDAEIVPLRVAWRERLGDVLKGAGPLAGRLQDRLLRRRPEGVRVVAGEPARIGELRRRFEAATGGGDAAAFGSFVSRQGALALDRAQRRLTGRPKVPRLVVEEVTALARFKEGVAALAARTGRPVADVAAAAAGALTEMAAGQSPLALTAWRQLERVGARAYDIDVDTARLDELRRRSREGTLVFLPSHRSYMDPLVLRSALDAHGFPPNHILGGINVAFWPVGPVGRRAGLVFIRRKVRDDPVYSFVLREYIGWLVRKRFPLEWYLEGGRTRTGKLRPPRLGLLAYLVEAFRSAPGASDGTAVGEVHLVPTAIVYDQLYEVRTMAEEEHGAPKRPESFGWALGYARAQGGGLGAVHVRFGEPLSLTEGLGAAGDSVEKLAFEVCHRINRATPLTATSLVSLALLGAEHRPLTVAETVAVLAPLLDYVERRGLEVAGGVDLGSPAGTRATLDALCAHGVLRRERGGGEAEDGPSQGAAAGAGDPSRTAMSRQAKSHQPGADDGEPRWSVARPLEAAFYRNGGIHFFVNRALVELIALRVAGPGSEASPGPPGRPDPIADGWSEALGLRDLLKFEFFFARKRDFAVELAAELDLFDAEWSSRRDGPEEVWRRLTASGLFVAHRVLRPFLEAYLVVARRLADSGGLGPGDEEGFVSACIGESRRWLQEGRLASPEATSRELFRTGWRLAVHRELLAGDALGARRSAFVAEVEEALERVEKVRRAAAARPAPAGGGAR